MQHFIYKTTNKINGKYYYGQHSTDCLDDGYLGSGVALRRAVKKHGKENFVREIIQFAPNKETLNKLEEAYVSECDVANPMCYNLKSGGNQRVIFSSASRAKMSAARTGKKLSEDGKAKLSIANKGKKLTQEHKAKLSAANKGQHVSEEKRSKISAALTGRKHTPESVQKMCGRMNSPEQSRATIAAHRKSGAGIQKRSTGFVVRIHFNRKRKYLGSFRSYSEALAARLQAEKEYWT